MNDSAVRRLDLAAAGLAAGAERTFPLDQGSFTFPDVVLPD